MPTWASSCSFQILLSSSTVARSSLQETANLYWVSFFFFFLRKCFVVMILLCIYGRLGIWIVCGWWVSGRFVWLEGYSFQCEEVDLLDVPMVDQALVLDKVALTTSFFKTPFGSLLIFSLLAAVCGHGLFSALIGNKDYFSEYRTWFLLFLVQSPNWI
jgi:hypothetical protein